MKPLLTPTETAELLGVSTRTLDDWRHRRTGPPWARVGRHVRYTADGLDAWVASRVGQAAG